MKIITKRWLLILLIGCLFLFPNHVKAASKKIDFPGFSVTLSNAIQKKYDASYNTSTNSGIRFCAKGTSSFRFSLQVYSQDYYTDLYTGQIIYKGILKNTSSGVKYNFLFSVATHGVTNASEIKQDIETIYKTLKIKSGYKFYTYKESKLKGWRKAYLDALDVNRTGDGRWFSSYNYYYYPIFINSGIIPEIVAIGKSSSYANFILTYYKGTVFYNALGDYGENGTVYYIPKGNKILYRGKLGTTNYTDYISVISKGKLALKKWGTFVSSTGKPENGTAFNWSKSAQRYDLKKVSKNKYIQYLNKAFAFSKAKTLKKPRTKDEMFIYFLFGNI